MPISARTASACRTVARPEPERAPDSYDDDLSWILDRLSERAGAVFAVILRFTEGSSRADELARSSGDSDLRGLAFDRLCQAVAPSHHGGSTGTRDDRLHKLSLDLQPFGLDPVRVLSLRFVPTPGVTLVVSVCRPESSFNLLHEFVAARLQPVLTRYLKLWWLHRTERRRSRLFQATVDDLEMGVLMLDSRGRIAYRNHCAGRLLEAHDGVRSVNGGIAASSLTNVDALQRAIDSQVAAGTVESSCVLLSLTRVQKRPLIVSLVRAGGPIEPGDVVVVLYLVDPEQDVGELLRPAFRIYRLTATEARLVTLLVSGIELGGAAQTMNLALHTARSYLKQVFLKTGTHRQAELVRIMCSSAARSSVNADLALL